MNDLKDLTYIYAKEKKERKSFINILNNECAMNNNYIYFCDFFYFI